LPRAAAAFSLIELLVVIGIITILTGIVLAVVASSRKAASAVTCAANLRQVHAAFLQYHDDNEGWYPDAFAAGTSWEQLLRKYAPGGPTTFRCTADPELYHALGSSYDWRDTGRPETTLSGKHRSDRHRPEGVLAFDALPGWHTKDRMTALHIDGSAGSMDAGECLADLQKPIRVGP
jgi:prepilin-type N-terminal cleavage/methylation domain-containing protein